LRTRLNLPRGSRATAAGHRRANRVLTESADWAAAEAFAQQRDQLAGP
jgi:hypothetical protein